MAIPVARIAAVTFVGGLLAVTALAGQPAAGPDAGVVAPQLAKMDGERKNRGEGRREGGRRRSGGDGAALACEACAGIEGYVPPSEIADEVRLMVGKTRGGDKNYAVQVFASMTIGATRMEENRVGYIECDPGASPTTDA